MNYPNGSIRAIGTHTDAQTSAWVYHPTPVKQKQLNEFLMRIPKVVAYTIKKLMVSPIFFIRKKDGTSISSRTTEAQFNDHEETYPLLLIQISSIKFPRLK